jgi:hypothetical protein
MIFLTTTERIEDRPGTPKQVLRSPFVQLHPIDNVPCQCGLSVLMERLIPWYLFACLLCRSPLLRTPFPALVCSLS